MAKRACTTSRSKGWNQMCTSNHLPWIEKSKSIHVRLLYKGDLGQTSVFHARFVILQWGQPSNPQNLEVLLHRSTSIVEPCFHMTNTQYTGIPVRVVRRHLP